MRSQQCLTIGAVIASLLGCTRPPGQVARPAHDQAEEAQPGITDEEIAAALGDDEDE